MTQNNKKVTLAELKTSINDIQYDTEFWYDGLLWFIGTVESGKYKYAVYATNASGDVVHDDDLEHLEDIWSYKFNGKLLTTIVDEITPKSIATY